MFVIPDYPSILTVGARGTERLLHGEIVVQEKVDGSLFAFGIDAQGNIGCRSKRQQLDMDAPPAMFAAAVDSIRRGTVNWIPGYTSLVLYCEYLNQPKHNALAYDRMPNNRLVLFDVSKDGVLQDPACLSHYAELLGIDVIPQLYRGNVAHLNDLKPLLEQPSYLGGQTVEGIVIKNYNELVALGGNTYPVFCKWVNEAFKERNADTWSKQSNKNKLETYLESFRTEARWLKAIQHLREQGALLDAPQDIGPLIKEVHRDIEQEEAENIRHELYSMCIGEIKRHATRGLAEKYKAWLADNVASGGAT